MDRKLLLILALAITGIIVPLGAVRAGAQLSDPSQTLSTTSNNLNNTLDNTTNSTNNTLNNTTDQLNNTANNTLNQAGSATGGSTGSVVPSTGTAPAPTSPAPAPAPAPTGTTGTSGTSGTSGAVGPGGAGGSGGRGKPGGGGHNHHGNGGLAAQHPNAIPHRPKRKPNGVPTKANPTLSIAGVGPAPLGSIGPAPLGVPTFMISQFEIPPFLLPIYQACGTQYGIQWEVLAGINKIETAFGTNLNVSTAGAVGWMQFIPSTWRAYGVDANGDGRKDPYNPVDAICAAARYLKAAGGDTDVRRGIFAYNHASWYVDEVLLYARQYGKLPEDLVGSLTGLTEGDRFPVAARSRYADDISERAAKKRADSGGGSGNVADVVTSSPTRRGINIYSREGARVVAVNDGTIKQIGQSKKLGKFLVLEDNYGNRFTYAQLGKVSKFYPVPKQHKLEKSDFKLVTPNDKAPTQPATRGKPPTVQAANASSRKPESEPRSNQGQASHNGPHGTAGASGRSANDQDAGRRLFALPHRHHNIKLAEMMGQLDGLLAKAGKRILGSSPAWTPRPKHGMEMRPLKKGSDVQAGTTLGRIGKTTTLAPHLNFSIRPTGRGAPKIDPKPILDGWRLLEETAIYRAAGKNPFADVSTNNVTQDLLLPRAALEHKVLSDPRLSIYACGRNDIATGQVDQRILAAMEYLADNGFRLTITSIKCGHSTLTSSGYVSEHSTGDAMDIAVVNDIPIVGHQGPGSITEAVIKTLLRLQGNMEPHQIISLMNLGGPSFSMADHYDHIHVGYYPKGSPDAKHGQQFETLLKPDQWQKLIGRIGEIRNPKVPTSPSRYSLPAHNHGQGTKAARD